MNTVNLVLGIHNHQPVGNFDHVFEHAYNHSYKKFLEVLERHPGVKLTLHNTGILLDWIHTHHPEWFDLVRRLVDRGQVELMTGGFYEPIFSVIPDRDKAGQIEKLSSYLKEHFNYQPRGMWLAERVWEPHLAKPLADMGIEYVALDTSHFQTAGLSEENAVGYFVTEEQSSLLKVFPISEYLRYTIPFQPVEKTIDYLRSMATTDGKRTIVMADDGEKFGVWPMTYNSVYEQNWLDNFFTALEQNSDWIKSCTFSEAVDATEPLGRIYLPTASYVEMMEWTLPPAMQIRFEKIKTEIKKAGQQKRYEGLLKGGFWRNFLTRYIESNTMQKTMYWLSDRIEESKKKFSSAKFKKAQDEIWKAQCNCPYWHGVFGGLYLPHLRFAIYRHLTRAANLLAEAVHKDEESWLEIMPCDIQRQGFDDLVVDSNHFVGVFTPRYGGSLRTLMLRKEEFNLLDTLARRPEAYHEQVRQGDKETPQDGSASIHDIVTSKEKGLDQYLNYDWHHRAAFQDHVISMQSTIEDMAQSKQNELGDFILECYEWEPKKTRNGLTLTLTRDGLCGGEPLRIEKKIQMFHKERAFKADYSLKNMGSTTLLFRFGVEFNAALLGGNAPDRYYRIEDEELQESHLASRGMVEKVKHFEIHDEWLNLLLSWDLEEPCTLWRFPIETVSNSESGFERVYQSSVAMPTWEIQLEPGKEKKIAFQWEMKSR